MDTVDSLAEQIYVALIGGGNGEGVTLEQALRTYPSVAYAYTEAFERERLGRKKNPARFRAGF